MLFASCLRSCVQTGSVAQSDTYPTGDQVARGFDARWVRQHHFVETDLEILSTVILSLPLIQEGQLSAVVWRKICISIG